MSRKSRMNRRRFLHASMTGLAGTSMISGTRFRDGKQEEQAKEPKIQEYRTLGRTGFKVSDIGYGTGMSSNANVLKVALDRGLNYIDTAEHYVGGQSERAVGEALKNRDRKKIFVTTKLNLIFGGGSTKETLKERFAKCLERLQMDYADCLMIHMTSTADQVKHEAYHEAIAELKAEGRVRFTGLSNHGLEQQIYGKVKDPMEKVLMAAVDDGRFDVTLFVYNFLQKEQGEKIIEACETKNMGVTLMKTNPVKVFNRWKYGIDKALEKGRTIPEPILKERDDYQSFIDTGKAFFEKFGLKSDADVRDAAIKFVLSHPGVHSVCPSINSFDDLDTYLALSGEKLDSKETSMLRDYESGLGRFYCRHACGICEPTCLHSVPVNTIMRYNHYFEAQYREKHAMKKYAKLSRGANRCQDCTGPCVSACPYHVPIQSLLMAAHENLTLG